jgi:hypothetical protein
MTTNYHHRLSDNSFDYDTNSFQHQRRQSTIDDESANIFHLRSTAIVTATINNSSSSPLSTSSSSLSDVSHIDLTDSNKLHSNADQKKRKRRRDDVDVVKLETEVNDDNDDRKLDTIRIDIDDSCDGTQGACTICGDKASGYHYGIEINYI